MAGTRDGQTGLGSKGLGRWKDVVANPADVDLPQFQPTAPREPGDQRNFPVTPWAFPDSTRVKAYSYDYGSQELRVRFSKYDTPWVYEGVPVNVFEAFDAAPSKGQFINSALNQLTNRRASHSEESGHKYP